MKRTYLFAIAAGLYAQISEAFVTSRYDPSTFGKSYSRKVMRAPIEDHMFYLERIKLFQTKDDTSNENGKWRAEFQGMQYTEDSGLVDIAVSLLTSDIFSTIFGFIGLIVCLVNRLNADFDSGETMTGIQSRSDILAVVACGSVLLNGLTKLDVTSALAEQVQLEGSKFKTSVIAESISEYDRDNLIWGIDSLLSSTPATSAIILSSGNDGSWKTVAISGILPKNEYVRNGVGAMDKSPIIDRFRKQKGNNRSETYLPTLQALPGKFEFRYLPGNTQAALLLPLGGNDESSSCSVLVLGSDTAKIFTPKDVAWCLAITTKLTI